MATIFLISTVKDNGCFGILNGEFVQTVLGILGMILGILEIKRKMMLGIKRKVV